MSIAGQRSARKAQSATTAAEIERQNSLTNQGISKVQELVPKVGAKATQEGQQESAQDRLAAMIANSEAGPSAPSALAPRKDRVIRGEFDKAGSERTAFSGQQREARARLESLGDVLLNQRILQSQLAGDIGTLSSFKRGYAGLFPLEMAAAAQEGSTMRGLGDIFKMAGGLTSMGSALTVPSAGASSSLANSTMATGNWPIFSGPLVSMRPTII